MKKSLVSCLGAILGVLVFTAPAHASYISGAWGFFIVLSSIPVAVAATLCTLLCWSLELFKKPGFFLFYSGVFIVAALVAMGLSLSANDPASPGFAAVGETILLVPVLLPAVLQHARSRRPEAAAESSPEAEPPGPGGPAQPARP